MMSPIIGRSLWILFLSGKRIGNWPTTTKLLRPHDDLKMKQPHCYYYLRERTSCWRMTKPVPTSFPILLMKARSCDGSQRGTNASGANDLFRTKIVIPCEGGVCHKNATNGHRGGQSINVFQQEIRRRDPCQKCAVAALTLRNVTLT